MKNEPVKKGDSELYEPQWNNSVGVYTLLVLCSKHFWEWLTLRFRMSCWKQTKFAVIQTKLTIGLTYISIIENLPVVI